MMKPIYLLTSDETAGAVRVDRFPDAPLSVHTLAIYTANFVGTVKIEATIKLNPTAADWFEVHAELFAPRVSLEPSRRNKAVTVTGRFIWMRATRLPDLFRQHGIVDRITVI